MLQLAVLGALCFLFTGTLAPAQIRLSAQTERTNFLLYERVDLHITVSNAGENDLILDNTEGHPWLSFLVSKHNKLPVAQERKSAFNPVTLKVGETKTLTVDITPLFSFREEGDYTAAVVVDLPGAGEVVSDPVPFSVVRGRQVWTQTRPVDGSERVYSLIRFSPSNELTRLYLRVEDPSENTILTNLALGDVVAFIDPEVFFDPQGFLHVMQPIAMGTYLYTRTDQAGKIVHQSVFKSSPVPGVMGTVPPRLTKLEDGNIIVVGGREEDPNAQREILSQGQKKGTGQLEKRPTPEGAPPSP